MVRLTKKYDTSAESQVPRAVLGVGLMLIASVLSQQLKNYGHFYRVNLFFLATLFLLSVTLIVLHKTKQLCCDDNLN